MEKILISHPGATVGSFALPENLSIADAFELANKLIEYAKVKISVNKNKSTAKSLSKKAFQLHGVQFL